jgi:hypothetical protein
MFCPMYLRFFLTKDSWFAPWKNCEAMVYRYKQKKPLHPYIKLSQKLVHSNVPMQPADEICVTQLRVECLEGTETLFDSSRQRPTVSPSPNPQQNYQ